MRTALTRLSDAVLMYLHAMDTTIGPDNTIRRDISEWLGGKFTEDIMSNSARRKIFEQHKEIEHLRGTVSKLAALAQHSDGCSWITPLPTGQGYWGCDCGLNGLVLDGEPTEAALTPNPYGRERNEMKAEDRTKNLMTLLGWKGGTIHDACRTLGIADSHSFLYDAAEFDNDGPSFDFRRGYGDACKYRRAPWSGRIETTEYWLGAVCAVINDFQRRNTMQKEKREALVSLSNPAAVDAVRAAVREINGFDQPEFKSETHVKFTFVGDAMDCVKCMAAGASMVS